VPVIRRRLGGIAIAAQVRADGGDGAQLQDWLAFVAHSPAPLALLPAEDALGLEEQPNLPGVVEGHPNWRRRLPAAAPGLESTLAGFAQARQRRTPA